jgi:hypothetical protein
LTTLYQKKSERVKLKNGFYHPKNSSKRVVISEEEFIEKISKSQSKHFGLIDEHELIHQFQSQAKANFEGASDTVLSNYQSQATNNLLFYHWYERRYKKSVINSDILYSLNSNTILSWYNKFYKNDLHPKVHNKLETHFKSERFPEFSVYYEYFYNFFPSIEKFDFHEFLQKEFVKYLLELFPKIVAIDYKNYKNFWRYTEAELKKLGDDAYHMLTIDRHNSHNAIIYNRHNLPCFYPSKIGEKNYEYYKIDFQATHTPLSIIERFKRRNLENEIREERGMPKIGEGWISETLLYYKIKENFPKYNIIQHGKPKWLGLQHLDIYMPELNIAIEYQGRQHQIPIEYFGGETAFQKNQERDNRKKKLCDENNCLLFYVYPDDDIENLIKDLKNIVDK